MIAGRGRAVEHTRGDRQLSLFKMMDWAGQFDRRNIS